MTPEQKVLRDVWLSECWKPCPEWHQTKDEKADANERNGLLAGRAQVVPELSTGCAENAAQKSLGTATECA